MEVKVGRTMYFEYTELYSLDSKFVDNLVLCSTVVQPVKTSASNPKLKIFIDTPCSHNAHT
jgi:hypothetical protein